VLPFAIGMLEKWNIGIMGNKLRPSTEFDLIP
jgi:hypothetical protein